MGLLNLSHYKSFEEERVSIMSLVCLVHSIPFGDQNSFYEDINLQNGVEIRRKKSIGNFLSLVKEYDVLKSYQNLQVYASEDEMALLCPDRVLYHYQDENFLKDIDIVGQYIYVISKEEACSGVEIREEEVNNLYFLNFSAFVLENKTNFIYDEHEVTMSYEPNTRTFRITRKETESSEANEDLLLEIRGISKSIAYPYVLYVLKNLDRDTQSYHATTCTVTKIVKK